MNVRDVMSAQVFTVSPRDTAQSVARLMAEAGVGALPVEAPGAGVVLGIVTDRDIVSSITAEGLASTMTVAEFMTVSAETCTEDEDLADVARRMSALDMRRLVVLDGNRKVIGLVTFSDILRAKPEIGEQLPPLFHKTGGRNTRIPPS
ncbi:MAG: CBS domain-containing protein [Shinella sp.]|nr:CBS domain-containing protein [Shinella sp.]